MHVRRFDRRRDAERRRVGRGAVTSAPLAAREAGPEGGHRGEEPGAIGGGGGRRGRRRRRVAVGPARPVPATSWPGPPAVVGGAAVVLGASVAGGGTVVLGTTTLDVASGPGLGSPMPTWEATSATARWTGPGRTDAAARPVVAATTMLTAPPTTTALWASRRRERADRHDLAGRLGVARCPSDVPGRLGAYAATAAGQQFGQAVVPRRQGLVHQLGEGRVEGVGDLGRDRAELVREGRRPGGCRRRHDAVNVRSRSWDTRPSRARRDSTPRCCRAFTAPTWQPRMSATSASDRPPTQRRVMTVRCDLGQVGDRVEHGPRRRRRLDRGHRVVGRHDAVLVARSGRPRPAGGCGSCARPPSGGGRS